MNKTEPKKARRWREHHKLTVAQLADLTGYSEMAIYWFERGETPPKRRAKSGNDSDRTVAPWVWLRYKRACQGVQAELDGGRFEW